MDKQEDDKSCGNVGGACHGGKGDDGDKGDGGVTEQAKDYLTPVLNNKPSASLSDGSHAKLIPTIPTWTIPAVGDTSSDLQSINNFHFTGFHREDTCPKLSDNHNLWQSMPAFVTQTKR